MKEPEHNGPKKEFPDYQSRIDHLKKMSPYHFDPFKQEPPQFEILGHFYGADWMSEVRAIEQAGNQTPFGFLNCCSNSRAHNIKNYQFDLDLTNDKSYSMEHVFVDRIKLEATPRENSPNLHKMIDWFGFVPGIIEARVHIQKPGQVFPIHVDGLDSRKISPEVMKEMKNNPKKWRRVQVMLEDWIWGHVWAMGNSYWHQWRAGEIMNFNWWETPHGTANFGYSNRYTLQITGVPTEITFERLRDKDQRIDLSNL